MTRSLGSYCDWLDQELNFKGPLMDTTVSFFTVLYLLIMGHAIADFALQSNEMRKGKNRNHPPENVPPGQTPATVWVYWLTAHSMIHAAVVLIITGNVFLSIGELIAHLVIDFFKCENELTVHQDQALHLAFNVIWAVIFVFSGASWVPVVEMCLSLSGPVMIGAILSRLLVSSLQN